MNGRVYDPRLGRFLQADPFVQAPRNTQNLNRYSYVLNNPLSYTDPSGYFFSSLLKNFGRFLGRWGKAIIAGVIGYGFGVAAGLGAAGAGAAAGAAAGYQLTGTLQGAFYGAVIGYGLGGAFAAGEAVAFLDPDLWLSIMKFYDGHAAHAFRSAGTGKWAGLKFGQNVNTGAPASQLESGSGASAPGAMLARAPSKVAGPSVATVIDEVNGFTTRSGVVVSYGSNAETGEHRYRVRAMICSMSTPGCDESYADRVYAHVNRNDIPFIDNDLGSGNRELLPYWFGVIRIGRQPIFHTEDSITRRSQNLTRPGHLLHPLDPIAPPGSVTHSVLFDRGRLYYQVLGEGGGPFPEMNNLMGIYLFRPGVESVVEQFRY